MDEKEIEGIKLHVAGATVRHTLPFEHLKSFKNDFDLSQDFLDKWVILFYFDIGKTDKEWVSKLTVAKCEITPDIILSMLGAFDWRIRQTGAFFSAITNQTQFIDIIGTHLLKSEVCYAGEVYCQVFASFNTPKCVEYLNLYLDYYLSKPDLWFDQKDALEAIAYLDQKNSTNYFDRHLNNWTEFLKNKPGWRKEIKPEGLEKKLKVINTVRAQPC